MGAAGTPLSLSKTVSVTTISAPTAYSLGALEVQLFGLFSGARTTPSIALTHTQAQALIPLVQQWQVNPSLVSQELWNQVQALLTPAQLAYQSPRPLRAVPQKVQGMILSRLLTRLGKM